MEKVIVTINREYGSGGRQIAKRLAELLDVPYYDGQIIDLAAQKTGFSKEFVSETEQKNTSRFLFNVNLDPNNLPAADKIFIAQAEIIKQIATNGSCIIVGRCADYILRDNPNILKVFIYAPWEERAKRVVEEYKELSPTGNIKNYLLKHNKQRAKYYSFYTNEKWVDMHNYDIALNSKIGVEACALAIKDFALEKEAYIKSQIHTE